MKTLPILLVLVLLLIAGCAPARDDLTSQPSDNRAQSEEIAPMPESSLSETDQKALLESVAGQQNVSMDQLTITEVQEADWPDACLGLAGPDEFCAQMVTPGWAVAVSDGQQTWKYRTNLDMTQVKLERQ